MRSSEDTKNTVPALYEDDIPGGGLLICCGACGCPQEHKVPVDTPYFCISCGVELFYRPWHEW